MIHLSDLYRYFSFITLGLVASSGHAAGLLELYQQALGHDPRFQAEYHEKLARDERYYQARAALLPQVAMYARASQIGQNIVSSDNQVFGSGSTRYPTTVYGLSLTQSVYDYSRWAVLRQADVEIQLAGAELEIANQGLMLRVAEKYLESLSYYENLSFLQAEKRQLQANYELVRARRQDGLAREVEALDAEARLLRVEARELELTDLLRDVLNALGEMTGGVPEQLRLMPEQLALEQPTPSVLEPWLELARENNPRLQAAILQRSIMEQEDKVRKGSYYPTVDLQLSYEDDKTEGSLFGGGSQVQTQAIRLSVNVPLYAGGLNSSRIREVRQRIESTRAKEMQVRSEIEREVQTAHRFVTTAMARERALRGSLMASERIAQTRKIEFESGLTRLTDLLDAERELFFARSELAGARYDYLMGLLRLKHAAGVLQIDDIQLVDGMLREGIAL